MPDSWTWGCDVFRQKTNPSAQNPLTPTDANGRPVALPVGQSDPYLNGLETGGIEESYQGIEMFYDFMPPWGDPTTFDNSPGGATPTRGWMYNDQPWDNECETPADGGPQHGMLQCNYVWPASSESVQVDLVFEGTLESFPAPQVEQSLAVALASDVGDVTITLEAGSVIGHLRVLATPLRIDTIYNRVLNITQSAAEASRVLGVTVEQVVSVQRVGASPSAPPAPPQAPPRPSGPPPSPSAPPAQTVLSHALTLVGTPATIDMEAFTGAVSIALRIGTAYIDATVEQIAPALSRVQMGVRSNRLMLPRMMSYRFGTTEAANATLSPYGIYVAHPLPPSPPSPPTEPAPPAAPPSPPSPPAPPASPPTPPLPAHKCIPSGADDVCSPFVDATWSSAVASYHFYLYDEVPDGVDLRLWEWPRVTPTDNQLANNGICARSHPLNRTNARARAYAPLSSGSSSPSAPSAPFPDPDQARTGCRR